ncbi:CDP-alcohol phosphatidyltransferase family protein [Aidingimonas lacisalsi]|uniref:CDP-alcohol phosphatidyltransferase family protein n=1 Tax=Aidingimonas lacisalsi TaxID=2604086 RepID=UPI0011D21686|nr:CDP-alcohol phosphatidyltransferase family protein [Aidingimonas lacisalsi]
MTRHVNTQGGTRSRLPLAMVWELGVGLLVAALLTETVRLITAAPVTFHLGVGSIYLGMAGLLLWWWPTTHSNFGWANRITLFRGVLIAIFTGLLWVPALLARHADLVLGVTLVALLLDGLDGWVARRTATTTAFGARFDMELDAFFILMLCVAAILLDKVAPWVLAIGALRYVFVAAGSLWPWLSVGLPVSRRRKVICVWQVVTLLAILLPSISATAATGLAAVSLLSLAVSFLTDAIWLYRQSHADRV